MKYPHRLQAALLLDARFDGLNDAVRDFTRIAEMKSGARLAAIDHRPGTLAHLFDSARELLVTFEYIASPPEQAVFASALASPITTLVTPDMRARVGRAQGHILVEIAHGPLAPRQSNFLSSPGLGTMPRPFDADADLEAERANSLTPKGTASPSPPDSAATFHERLDLLVLAVRIACEHVQPGAIHWTQSNQLFIPQTFETLCASGFPGPLTIHPILFGSIDKKTEGAQVGLRTFGARHFLGREIVVPATRLPWSSAYEAVLAFCAFATMDDGYVIPDGDTFSPPPPEGGEPGGEVWRVHHREPAIMASNDDGDARGGDVPVFELVPVRNDAFGFLGEGSGASVAEGQSDHVGTESVELAPESTDPEATPGSSHLEELEAALAQGLAEAAANPPDPLLANPQPTLVSGTPSNPGDATVSGRSLRARVFGKKED